MTTANAEATYRFDRPATILSGPIGTGKSSLLMLIKHVLGGSAMLTPAVRDNVLSVQAEIEAGDERVVLKRALLGHASAYVEVRESRSLTLERTLRVGAAGDEPSVSDYLLDAIGFPREQVAARREGVAAPQNLTFNDLFMYVYVQAREIDRQVVGHLEGWFEPKRKELFRLMFGLTDSELMDLKLQASKLKDEVKDRDTERMNVARFLEASDARTDDELRAELVELRGTLERAQEALESLRGELVQENAADTALRSELAAAVADARLSQDQMAAAHEVLGSRRAIIAQLQVDLARLERSGSAVSHLTPFDYVTCPRCTQPLTARTVPEGHCLVCCQPDPVNDDADAALGEARAELVKQLEEATRLEADDLALRERAQDRAQVADLRVMLLRRQLDARTRDAVAPRFDAVADASARVAMLKAAIDAVTSLRDTWARVRAIAKAVSELKSTQRTVAKKIKERNALFAARRALVVELSMEFDELLEAWRLPWKQSACIDTDTFLPIVNDAPFEAQQASGGGIATSINVAYSLSLLTFSVDHPDVLVPSLLIVDSPRKAFGNNDRDRQAAEQIYSRFRTLAETYGEQGRLQLIIADNDPPPVTSDFFGRVEFDYGNAMVPGVAHPGPEHAKRLEDL
ncbi:AAA family ATPase [Yinghuangia sp. ASG 101]|uniref:AAA family ATPase n=1 Tax=Yinghuangia sp. ASG 101 TaxID=2896848 RepID=UPI001E3771EA|nr:AAA family ATPase [Yinghuangia sp. ASG 101]UGQ14865.1 AAA family ATPase [Yinghuangia sp. ASG 101]